MIKKLPNKYPGRDYINAKEFITEMRVFKNQFNVDWLIIEDKLMSETCSSCCFGCFKKIGIKLKHHFRKTRLKKMDLKPKKGVIDYLIYSGV